MFRVYITPKTTIFLLCHFPLIQRNIYYCVPLSGTAFYQGSASKQSKVTDFKFSIPKAIFLNILHSSSPSYCSRGNHYEVTNASEKGTDIVELLEAIAYLICQDDPIRVDTFYKIVSSRGVPAKILRLADTNYDGVVSVEEMMSFIMIITNPRLVLLNFHHFGRVWVIS